MTSEARVAVELEDSFAYLIYRTARLLRHDFAQLIAGLGCEVTQEQWFMLNKLADRPAQTQTELCDGVFVDRPNLTRMLATMQRNGWLKREADRSDARKVRVSLTARGSTLQLRIRDLVLAERRRLFAGLNKQDLLELRRILGVLERNMVAVRGDDLV